MIRPRTFFSQLRERLVRVTLTEWLLLGILCCAFANWSKQGDIEDKLQKVEESLAGVKSEVSDESSDIQRKLDDLKSALDDIAANQ